MPLWPHYIAQSEPLLPETIEMQCAALGGYDGPMRGSGRPDQKGRRGGGFSARARGRGAGPVAEAKDPKPPSSAEIRPNGWFERDTDASAASSGDLSGVSSPMYGAAAVQGSGMTLEQLMEEDARRHTFARTLTAQMTRHAEDGKLDVGKFPVLVAADGNADMLDDDAKVRRVPIPQDISAACILLCFCMYYYGVVLIACTVKAL